MTWLRFLVACMASKEPHGRGAKQAEGTTAAASQWQPSISVVVTGFGGSPQRAAVLNHNMRMVSAMPIILHSCNIFIYRSESDLSNASVQTLLKDCTPCQFPRQSGMWMHHVRAHDPVLLTQRSLQRSLFADAVALRTIASNVSLTARRREVGLPDFVMLALDSVKMEPNVYLLQLSRIMTTNCLGMAGPACPNAKTKILIKPNRAYDNTSTCGRLVEYIDAQLDLMTLDAFHCLHRIIDVIGLKTDPYGWTAYRMLPAFCGIRVGVIDSMIVTKLTTGGSYSWQAAFKSSIRGFEALDKAVPGLRRPDSKRIIGPLQRPPRGILHPHGEARPPCNYTRRQEDGTIEQSNIAE